jgi:uncharacterized protein DUF3617
MKSGAALVVTAVVLASAGRAVRAETLNVKLGTWETTSVSSASGMHVPEAQLQQLPPEQRQKIEAMLKQREAEGPKTHTSRSCLTKEKLEKFFDETGQDEKSCKRSSVVATATRQQATIECAGKHPAKGELHAEALSREHVKGGMKMATEMGNMTVEFESKWISAACEKEH